MAESDLSISQLPPLTLPVQGSDLLHVSRGGDDFRISRTELVKTFLSQLADANISGTATGQALIFNTTTGKWVNQFVSWATITGKPGTFPPTVHTHLWAEITDAPTELPPSAHQHAWTDLTGVPSSFPVDPHTHGWDDLTDVPSVFPPDAHVHEWSEITDKPTEFPAGAHDHASLYYNKVELNTSGAGGQVHWDNITSKPETFGTGDMSKSQYDQDDDGVVDVAIHAITAGEVDWYTIQSLPDEFPPSAHDHDDRYWTKETLSTIVGETGKVIAWENITDSPWMNRNIYDEDDDGIVDLAAAVPWSGITDKPATFPPDDHNHDDLYSLLGHTHNYLSDAPSDNRIYGRKDGEWVEGGVTVGSNSWVTNDTPWIGTANGANTAFTFHSPYVPGSMQLYRDGQLLQGGGNDYVESDPTSGLVQFITAPADGSVILATYQTVVSTSGNADTLDGLHASAFVKTSEQASGIAVLSVPFDISGAHQVFQDTGLALNLPAAGTYAIDGSLRGVVANNMPNHQVYVKLYNATAGADIPDTETLIVYSQVANVIIQNTVSLTTIVTVTVPTTIKLYAARSMEPGSTWSFSRLDSNWAGKTRIRFIKVG